MVWIGRELVVDSTALTEFHCGNGFNIVTLKHDVQSITNVYEDNGAYHGTVAGSFAASNAPDCREALLRGGLIPDSNQSAMGPAPRFRQG